MSLLLCTLCTRMCRRAVHLKLKDWKVAGAQAGSGISHASYWVCCYQVATVRQRLEINHPR